MISTPKEINYFATGQQNRLGNAANSQSQLGGEQERLPRIATTLLLAAVGLIQAFAGRNMMNPDGIQYIEVALNYAQRNWSSAVNAYWSPLYSWALGLVLQIFRPSPSGEFALVHFANFAIYLLALLSFSFFLNELILYQQEITNSGRFVRVPTWVWQVFGYSLFLSSSLDLITLNMVTPDLVVSAFVYLIAALLMRIRRGQVRWTSFAALGFALGLGYLSKSAMFIFALIVLLVAFQLVRMQGIPVYRLVPAATLFLLVAIPLVAALSLQKGRLTIGETGKVAYLSSVNGLPSGYVHGVPSNPHLVFKHPPQRIYERPAAYEFGSVVLGSCPAWYDPSYWYDGMQLFFVPKNEVRALLKSVYGYAQILFLHQSSLLAGVLVLFFYIGNPQQIRKDISRLWYLLVPAVLLLGLYFLILVQDRYVGPFLVILWCSLFFGARVEASPSAHRIKQAVLLGTACALLATVGLRLARDAVKGAPDRHDPDRQNWALKDQEVAAELHKAGIGGGDKVAFIGDSIWVYWAHLAGIRIGAEIPEEDVDGFYEADSATRESVMRAFAASGVKAVIGDRFPPDMENGRWRQLGTSGYYLYNLR